MKYLLIGGSGFIGTNLTKQLLQQGHHVYNIDPQPQNIIHPHLHTTTDHNNPEQLRKYINKAHHIIYLASTSHVRNSQTQPQKEIDNLTNYINFLETLKNYENKTLHLASSAGHIYGNTYTQRNIRESHPTNPTSPYGITKLAMELYTKHYSNNYDFNYTILRFSNTYGPDRNTPGVGLINQLISDYSMGRTTPIVTNPEGITRDYIYIDDLTSAVILITQNPKTKNKTINISTGEGHTITDIIKIIEETLQVKLKVNPTFTDNNPPYVVPDNTLLKRLGWKQTTTPSKGVKKIWEVDHHPPSIV